MASGFDSTAFDTGLLGGINRNIEQQQNNVELGDKAQYEAFQEASRQYQTAKNKATDQKAKIDAVAPQIRFDNDDSDAARLASLAVARDGVTSGQESEKYLPFWQEAYRRTKADIQSNPKKWGIGAEAQDQDNARLASIDTGYAADTDPNNTASLHKFQPNLTTPQIEAIRQNKIDRPYSDLPGAVYPNAQEFDVKNATNKQTSLAEAKKTQEETNEHAGEHKLGLDMPDTVFSDQSDKSAGLMPKTDLPPVSASDINPDIGASGGININAPAPKASVEEDGTQGLNPEAAKASKDNTGKFSPDRFLDYIRQNDRVGAGIVEGLANGEFPINANALERPNPKDPDSVNPYWKYIVAAKRYDPSWSTTEFAARQKTANDYSPGGTVGKQVAAQNTALGHLGLLDQAVDALHNGKLADLNKVANNIGARTGGVPEVVFNGIMGRVAPEVVQAYRPSAGTGEEVEQARQDMARALSSEQGHAVVMTTAQALKSKMDTSRDMYINQMGPVVGPKKEFYTPEAKDTMNRLGLSTDISQQRQTLQAVQGKEPTANLPSFKSPNEVPPNVKTFMDPQGNIRSNPAYKEPQKGKPLPANQT